MGRQNEELAKQTTMQAPKGGNKVPYYHKCLICVEREAKTSYKGVKYCALCWNTRTKRKLKIWETL